MNFFGWLKSIFSRSYARHIDPPVTPCANQWDAMSKCSQFVAMFNGIMELTTGTPSMVPLCPAAPTYLAVKPIAFKDIRLGIVAVYHSPLSPTGLMCHRLVARGDATSYIASGDNNKYSEPQNYVRAENFVGEVMGIFTFPALAQSA